MAVSGTSSWSAKLPGVVRLPSGRLVRGRGLRTADFDDAPDFALYLLDSAPPPVPWETRWLRWPDFSVPSDAVEARAALTEVWRRAEHERVEVGCHGGRGRTGTALACLAVLDGVDPSEAVAFVRQRYDRRAVETLQQRRYVSRFRPVVGRGTATD